MKKTMVASLFAFGVSFFAHADYIEHPYVGLDYQTAKITNVNEAKIGSVLLRTGTNFYKYLGVEAQYSYGVKEGKFSTTDSTTNVTTNYSVKNRGSYGIYLKPTIPLGTKAEVYGLIGANYSDYRNEQTKENSYGTSFAYGAGANIYFVPHLGLGLEYMQYDKDAKAFNIGGRYKF